MKIVAGIQKPFRSSWQCYYCGTALSNEPRSPSQKTFDHKIPKSRGGTNHPSNIVSACRRCNEEKADRTHLEYQAWLKAKHAVFSSSE